MKKIICLLALISGSVYAAGNDPLYNVNALLGKSFFLTRSQSVNVARQDSGFYRFIDKPNMDGFYGAFETAVAYQKSTNTNRLAQYFFGSETVTISGSFVTDRGVNDLLADYFGLSPAFQSYVTILPKVSSVIVDLNLYLGWKNFFFRAYAPFARTRSIMELSEIIGTSTLADFPMNYMASTTVVPPAACWSSYMKGDVPPYGQVTETLQYGKMGCPQYRHGIADVRCMIGWNAVSNEKNSFGVNVEFAIPTGTRPDSRYLFEPIVGNGHHWELGGGFIGKTLVWESMGEQTIHVYYDARFTHLFGSHQIRSFDLCSNGFGSRYELTKLFDASGNYTGKTVPTINRTSLECNVYVSTQIDALIMGTYENNNLNLDFGYNLWARTRENVDPICPLAEHRFGLKGIQNVTNGSLLINATQHNATIQGNLFSQQSALTDDPSPQFIQECSLNLNSAASSRSFTNKFFANVMHTWDKGYDLKIIPHLSVGFEIEFEGVRPNNVEPNKNSLAQWGIWLKIGCSA